MATNGERVAAKIDFGSYTTQEYIITSLCIALKFNVLNEIFILDGFVNHYLRFLFCCLIWRQVIAHTTVM